MAFKLLIERELRGSQSQFIIYMLRNYLTNSLTGAIYMAAYLWFKQMFSCTMLRRSNGDVRIFQPPVVL